MPKLTFIEQIDKIRDIEEFLSSTYWQNHKTLAETEYKSKNEQFIAASNLGHLAKAIVLLQEARSHLMDF